jgi:pilus assembly protein CpaC
MLKTTPSRLLKIAPALLLGYSLQVDADITTSAESRHVTYQVPMNKSLLVNLDKNVSSIIEGQANIADFTLITPRQLLIRGRTIGGTNATLWDTNNHVDMIVDVEVTHNLDGIKKKLHELMPREAIEVRNADKCIVLSGQVSNMVNMDYAMKIAAGYISTPGGGSGGPSASSGCGFVSGGGGGGGASAGGSQSIINMMHVGGEQQVMLEVKIAEVSRSLTRALSLSSSASSATSSQQNGSFIWTALVGAAGAFSGSYVAGTTVFNWSLNFSRNTSLATILAEPNLTALSGRTASFLSGGEFPYVSNCSANGGACTTNFKPYGVSLKFTPVVLDSNRINLSAEVEVSQLTNTANQTLSQGISTSIIGNSPTPVLQPTPSLDVRGATSTLELADGQTMSIAGLLNVEHTQLQNQTPGLADIPVLGSLFNNRQAEMNDKELVILVTPHLAKPIPHDQIKLPTDYYVAPDDIEFYLLGRMEARKKTVNTVQVPTLDPLSGGTTGQFGHQINNGD